MHISPDEISACGIDTSVLDQKKQQTTYKIKYVTRYVKQWAIIEANRQKISVINFIDCMCNAGIYKDGDACTALEVINIFNELAVKFPQKLFRVYLNDINEDRIKTFKAIINRTVKRNSNLILKWANVDVNILLDNLAGNAKLENQMFSYGKCTLLYVDPYNFGTVEINKLHNILQKHYCELLFNLFTSDFVRNVDKDSGRIQKCLGGYKPKTKDEFITYVVNQLRTGKIQYIFSYSFHTMRNVELYQILYATPNIRGLEVLKESLWDVFDGEEFHRNSPYDNQNIEQLSMFTPQENKRIKLDEYAEEAKEIVRTAFTGMTVTYESIERKILEETMLTATQIIDPVLKPLIAEGKLQKCGNAGKRNYKGDNYIFL